MYIAAAILFLLPWTLLVCSWFAFQRGGITAPLPQWRNFLFYAALLGAFLSTVLNMIWNTSWLKSGGGPHGMSAGPGLWRHLGPFLVWSFMASTLLAMFGKRKARVLMLAWSVSMFRVFQGIYVLQFD